MYEDLLTRQLGSAGSEKHDKEDSWEVQELIARQGGEKICMKIIVCCLKGQIKNCLHSRGGCHRHQVR